MAIGPLVVELVAVFVLTALLLNKYADWHRQHLIVMLSTFIGWFFSFVIIFVLPLDVAITFYNRCKVEHARASNATGSLFSYCEEPGGYVPDAILLSLWRIVYWTAQLLTWLVLPFMQSYVNAGDFTAYGRMRAALFNNAIYYGLYMVVFSLLLVYAVIKGVVINTEHLKVILVSASNTWGLFLLVVLLGHGLVEIPRSLWYMGSRDYCLNKTYFNIDKLSSDKNDAEEALKEAYRETRAVLNVLKNEHGAREKAQVILSRFPEESVSPELSRLRRRHLNGAAPLDRLLRNHHDPLENLCCDCRCASLLHRPRFGSDHTNKLGTLPNKCVVVTPFTYLCHQMPSNVSSCGTSILQEHLFDSATQESHFRNPTSPQNSSSVESSGSGEEEAD